MGDSGLGRPHESRIPYPQSPMLNVGLTGNIAAGKSTVVDLFRAWGATIIDADQLAREAQAPGTEVLAAIAGRFGSDVLTSDGGLDRAALRSKVMGDDKALAALCLWIEVKPVKRAKVIRVVRPAKQRIQHPADNAVVPMMLLEAGSNLFFYLLVGSLKSLVHR